MIIQLARNQVVIDLAVKENFDSMVLVLKRFVKSLERFPLIDYKRILLNFCLEQESFVIKIQTWEF